MGAIQVDGCRSWAVALSATLINTLTGGIPHNYGLLFVALLDDFEKDESLAALPGSLFGAVAFLSGLVITPLADVYGWRLVIALGSVLSASGFFLSSFCQDIYLFCFIYGIITGFGVGLLFCGVMVRLQSYFCKHRALANGLLASGAGVGTMIFGPVVSVSLANFGWRNTLRIEAALLLMGLLTSPLFGPVEGETDNTEPSWYGTVDEPNSSPISDKSNIHTSEQNSDLQLTRMDRRMTLVQTCRDLCGRCKRDFSLFSNGSFLLVAFAGAAYVFGEIVIYTYLPEWAESNGIPDVEVGDLAVIIDFFDQDHMGLHALAVQAPSPKPAVTGINVTASAVPLITTPMRFALSRMAANQYQTSIPSSRHIKCSAGGGASVGSRLVFGFVMDQSMKVRCVSLGLSILLLGLTSFTIPLLDTFLLLAIYSACFGVFAGIFWSTYAIVIVDLLGEEIKDYAIGQALACFGVAALCSGPSAGLVMRWTGRLFTTIQFAGGVHVLGATAHFTAVFIYYRQEAKP